MLRFSIRDLLWLMVVVGLGVGWWADRRDIVHERESLAIKRQEIEELEENTHRSLHNLTKFYIAVRERLAPLTQQQLTADQLNFIQEQSKQLGAPQPKPLPPGYGEMPNP